MQLMPSSPLRDVALEIEQHVAESGWDQPPRLYALVSTKELLAKEPALVDEFDAADIRDDDALSSIEQDGIPSGADFESVLEQMMWPDLVVGCAAVVERIMLPPAAEIAMPDDPAEVEEYVADHPDRQEVRIVAAATRDGQSHSAVRARGDGDAELLEGPDLVPTLIGLLKQTLAD